MLSIYQKNTAILEAYHFCQLRKKFNPASCCQGKLHTQTALFGSSVWIANKPVIAGEYSASLRHFRQTGNTMGQSLSF